MESEINGWIGARISQKVYQIVVVKRELRCFTSQSVFEPSPVVMSLGCWMKEYDCGHKESKLVSSEWWLHSSVKSRHLEGPQRGTAVSLCKM